MDIVRHMLRWAGLPLISVPSAAVTDEQTEAWSKELYDADLDEDRKHDTRRALTLVGIGGMIAAGCIFGAGVAKASPDPCTALATSPTVGTVEQLVIAYMATGLAPGDAGELIAVDVLSGCPEYVPVLRRFIAAYAPSGSERV
jgi:hypothetical protein